MGTFQPLFCGYENGIEIIHPVLDIIKNGGTIQYVSVGTADNNEDNCYDITIIVDGEIYQYQDFYLSQETMRMYYQAEVMDEKALAALKEYLLLYV